MSMAIQNEPLSSVEQRAVAYSEAWKQVLDWKRLFTSETSQPIPKRVNILSILTPPPEMMAKMQANPQRHLEFDTTLSFLTQTTANYLSQGDISQFTPPVIQIILYPQHKDDDLFPEHGERAGFHLRRGGYPILLVPMRQNQDGSYALQPFVVGHELGEVAVSHMLRHLTGQIGPLASLESHPLKEGFCDMIGLDYYRFLTNQQGGKFLFDYDEVMSKDYRRRDIKKLLSDFSFDDASKEEKIFMRYRLAGSIVSRLVKEYGLQKVLKYFAAEANNVAKRDKKVNQFLERLKGLTGGSIEMTLRAEKIATPPEKPELREILSLLGYEPSQFGSLDSSTKPVDDKPEGAIAALIVDQFDSWFNKESHGYEASNKSEEVASDMAHDSKTMKSLSFIQRVKLGMNKEIAKTIFGSDFSVEEFIEDWKENFLQKVEKSTPREYPD